jgi:hypothetical protein
MTNPTVFTWVDPTTNVDGSPIAPGEITGYTLGIRDINATGSVVGTYPTQITAPATATSELFSALPTVLAPGTYVAAIETVTASNTSAWSSPEATFVIPAPIPVPNPPTGFSAS